MESNAIFALMLVPGVTLGTFVLHQVFFAVLSIVAALFPVASRAAAQDLRFVVIVPAHNEELLIDGTVRSILAADYPAGSLELFVVADNCTDGTAQTARAAGARCLERNDATLRGKPHALDWTISRLDLYRYDGLVIIDADTHLHADFFTRMAAHLRAGELSLQGYFGVLNPDQTWLTRLSLIPGALKFRLLFPGKELVGLSCPLAGNGMCFAIDVIKRYGWKAYSLTENWEYWVQLTLQGIRVGTAPDAIIYSQVANSLASGRSQRVRWMKGRIDTLRRYGAKLLLGGITRPSLMQLDALIELARPTAALMFVWSLAYLAATLAYASATAASHLPLVLAIALVGSQTVLFVLAFLWDRPPPRAWLALLMVPWYLIWKLAISVGGLLTLRDRDWIRTRRNQ